MYRVTGYHRLTKIKSLNEAIKKAKEFAMKDKKWGKVEIDREHQPYKQIYIATNHDEQLREQYAEEISS